MNGPDGEAQHLGLPASGKIAPHRLLDIITFDPKFAVLTSPVTNTGSSWLEYDDCVANGGQLPRILVSRVRRNRKRGFIILDGNHRACVLAKHGRRISAYLVTVGTKVDHILELENANRIQPFPHREFLTGEESYQHLIQRAIKASFELDESILQALRRLGLAPTPR
jgi:hypothetical protein